MAQVMLEEDRPQADGVTQANPGRGNCRTRIGLVERG